MGNGRSPGLARRAPEKPRSAPVADAQRPGHTHRLPRALLLTLVVICAGLVVSIVLVSTLAVQANRQSAETNRRLEALESFIEQRGNMRDRQNEDLESLIEERNRQTACGLLDGLPAGPVLDPLRATYGCGPGLSIEELSPEARTELRGYRAGAPLTTDSGPFDPNDYYAEPNPRYSAGSTGQPRETPAETTDAPTPTPTVAPPAVAPVQPSPPPPLIDLNPVTDPVCAALGICL